MKKHFIIAALASVCCQVNIAFALSESTPASTKTQSGNFDVIEQPNIAITTPADAAPGSYSVEESYLIKNGDKIADVLSEWCTRNGWVLSWGTAEILAEADAEISGSFESAVELLLDALNRGGAKVHATFYEANRVLRVGEKSR